MEESTRNGYTPEEIYRMTADEFQKKVLQGPAKTVIGVVEISPKVKRVRKKTKVQLATEMLALELEEKQLQIEIMRERSAKIKAEKEQLRKQALDQLNAIHQFIAQRTSAQEHCNHRKGGHGGWDIAHGKGTDAMYAITHHRKPNGRYMLICLRCCKEWHQEFNVGGLIVEPETPGFQEALKFPTDNKSSGSSLFFFEPVYAPVKKTTKRIKKSKTTA